MSRSPAVIPYSSDSVELGLKDGVTLPANIRGFVSVGIDGSTARFTVVDSSGNQVFVGAGTAGSPAGGVLSIQGVSGGQAVSVSQSGTWTVQQGTPPWAVKGTDADGAAPTENPVLVAGQDGANVQTLLSDTSGRSRVVGAAADGAAVTGDPVLVGGQDGTNAQSLLTDTSGRPRIVGAGPEDSAKVGDPVRVAGSDGTNTRDVLTDSGGRQVAVGAAADGSTPVGDPVLAAGWDGTNVETLKTNTAGRLQQVLFDDAGNELLGTKTQDGSIPVTFPSDLDPIPITFTPVDARTGIASADFGLGGGTAGAVYPMEATTYTEPTAEAQRSFASSSGNDTAAGTGARTVEFTYFDGSGNGPYTGEVTLAGTTPVDTTETDIRFIESMRVLTVGSSEANEGTISMYSATGGGGSVIGSIGYASVIPLRGDNQTLWCHHYIPTGWTGELAVMQCAIQSGGSGTSGRFFIRSTQPLVANSAEIVRAGYLLLPGAFQRSFQFHDTIEGFAKLTAYVIPSVNNTEVNCSFDWSEVPS